MVLLSFGLQLLRTYKCRWERQRKRDELRDVMFNLFSSPDQKANADEMLPYVLDNLGFQQSYVAEFTRLAMRVVAAAVAGALFYYERLMLWQDIYPWVCAAVVAYFGLQGGAWLIKRFVEHDAVYVGARDGKTLYVKTATPGSSKQYKVSCDFDGAVSTFTTTFPEFVDHNGRVVVTKIQPLLEAAIGPKKTS